MDDERDRTDQPLPGSVSDQNGEEAEPGHGGGEAHRQRSGAGGGDEKSAGKSGAGGKFGAGGKSGAGGESGEGSQSTGHPDSAG